MKKKNTSCHQSVTNTWGLYGPVSNIFVFRYQPSILCATKTQKFKSKSKKKRVKAVIPVVCKLPWSSPMLPYRRRGRLPKVYMHFQEWEFKFELRRFLLKFGKRGGAEVERVEIWAICVSLCRIEMPNALRLLRRFTSNLSSHALFCPRGPD